VTPHEQSRRVVPGTVGMTLINKRKVQMYEFWTGWRDYFATGEGRRLMAYIGHAQSEDVLRKFRAIKNQAGKDQGNICRRP
jgi:hypothetical protein